jgi:hypothetical protein
MGTIKDLQNKLKRFGKEIESLQSKTISLTILPDAKGMIDRQCPKDSCGQLFKTNLDDWKTIVRDEECFCPCCRNRSLAKDYLPSQQRSSVMHHLHLAIMNNWKYGQSIIGNLKALDCVGEFEIDMQCELCSLRFSVIGAAYFCPSCGHSSVVQNASETIQKTMLTATKIDSIRLSLEATQSKTEAAILIKAVIEHGVSACIGTLQAFSETIYNSSSITPAPFNAFQNTDRANRLWMDLKQQGYHHWLTQAEYTTLKLFTQRRHLLEHKGGIVDAKYLNATGDKDYNIGDRLVISPKDVINLCKVVQTIIDAINKT